jgi:AhpD family alkylhydroperoxidase
MKMKMKTMIVATIPKMTLLASVVLGLAGPARAEPASAGKAAKADIVKTFGFVPQFLLRIPEPMLPGLWDELKTLQMNPATALGGKTKELIGLGVAAQIPCRYCIVAHTEFAKLNGASEAEIGEAVAMAAIVRHWSTFLNGIQTDEAEFRADVARIVDNAKRTTATAKAAQTGSRPRVPASAAVVDGQSALDDITQVWGFVPEFYKRFPDVARAGAWRQLRDVRMNPNTALSGKDKELVGLAVAAQIPCKLCIIAGTELARLRGATEEEISEAIAMASLTRTFSTVFNGLQVDEPQFRRDIDRLVKGAKAAATAAAKPAAAKISTR